MAWARAWSSGLKRPSSPFKSSAAKLTTAADLLLEQRNARFLRFYYGRNEKGGRELVLVAADAAGNDLTGDEALILDGHFPCPPFCPTTTSALRG